MYFSLKKNFAVGWMHPFGKLPMIVSLLCVGVISKDSVYGRFHRIRLKEKRSVSYKRVCKGRRTDSHKKIE